MTCLLVLKLLMFRISDMRPMVEWIRMVGRWTAKTDLTSAGKFLVAEVEILSAFQLSDTLQLAEEVGVAFMLIWSVASIPWRGGVPMSMSCITSSRAMYEMTVYDGLILNQTLFFLAVHTSISPLPCPYFLPCCTINMLLDMFETWSC